MPCSLAKKPKTYAVLMLMGSRVTRSHYDPVYLEDKISPASILLRKTVRPAMRTYRDQIPECQP